MRTQAREAAELRQELVSAVTTLRLLVDGWRDRIVDPRPGTTDGLALRAQVRAIGELVDVRLRADPAAEDELSRLRRAG